MDDNNSCKCMCIDCDCLMCMFSFIYCIFLCIFFSFFINKYKDCVCWSDKNKELLIDEKNSKCRCDKIWCICKCCF